MKIEQLRPAPCHRTQFAWSHCSSVPNQPGCYALVNYSGDVLYVGLASRNICDRMRIHLDTPEKRSPGKYGVAFWFYYLPSSAGEVNKIERGWMNQAILDDGEIPPLNKVYSPV
jgi:hypothetical protein